MFWMGVIGFSMVAFVIIVLLCFISTLERVKLKDALIFSLIVTGFIDMLIIGVYLIYIATKVIRG